jgi:hypothetical protein
MLNHWRTLHDVDEYLCALAGVCWDTHVVMAERDNLMAPGGWRMHRDALGTVADFHRWTVIANPDFFTGVGPRY